MLLSRRVIVLFITALLAAFCYSGMVQAKPADSADFCAAEFNDRNELAGFTGKVCLTSPVKDQLKVTFTGSCKWFYVFFWGKPPLKCRIAEVKYTVITPNNMKIIDEMATHESVEGTIATTGQNFTCAQGSHQIELSYRLDMMGFDGDWSRQVEDKQVVTIDATC